MSMTHTLSIPYMEENRHLKGQGWSADPPCLSALYPQSGLKFGNWKHLKSMLSYLANIYFIKLIPN